MVTNVQYSQYIYTSIWLQMFSIVNTYIVKYIYTSIWLQMFIVVNTYIGSIRLQMFHAIVNTYIHLYGYKCSVLSSNGS